MKTLRQTFMSALGVGSNLIDGLLRRSEELGISTDDIHWLQTQEGKDAMDEAAEAVAQVLLKHRSRLMTHTIEVDYHGSFRPDPKISLLLANKTQSQKTERLGRYRLTPEPIKVHRGNECLDSARFFTAIKNDPRVALGKLDAQTLMDEEEKIPESWQEFKLLFPADVWNDSEGAGSGEAIILCMEFIGGHWTLYAVWPGNKLDGTYRVLMAPKDSFTEILEN